MQQGFKITNILMDGKSACIMLSWGSCTCAYWSKLKVEVLVVVDGDTCHYLARADPPPPTDGEGGRALIQKMKRATRSTIILPGMFLKVIML